jgi:hypothetical protein
MRTEIEMSTHVIEVEVQVQDHAELRAYALRRAIEGGIDEQEFETGETGETSAENVDYWLCWAFDAGTPEQCGFQINHSASTETA